MLWNRLQVISLNAIVHDLCMQTLSIMHLLLPFCVESFLESQERFARTPSNNGSGWSLVGRVPSHVESLVLLVHSRVLGVKVSIDFVHTRITTLP